MLLDVASSFILVLRVPPVIVPRDFTVVFSSLNCVLNIPPVIVLSIVTVVASSLIGVVNVLPAVASSLVEALNILPVVACSLMSVVNELAFVASVFMVDVGVWIEKPDDASYSFVNIADAVEAAFSPVVEIAVSVRVDKVSPRVVDIGVIANVCKVYFSLMVLA